MGSSVPKKSCPIDALAALGNAGEALLYNNARVGIINEDPKSNMFLFWLVISYYFPVITACMGPVANMISIACVVEKWRTYRDFEGHGTEGSDHGPAAIFVVNIVALVVGFLSNCVLVLHFINKLSYLNSQVINISGWSIAGTMLLVDVCAFAGRDTGPEVRKTIGFWYAVIAAALYYCCTFNLTVHFVGYYRGKYPPRFNLMKNERVLMIFTFLISLLLIWGAGMFSGLLSVTFGSALYYSIVSILTVGLGDITPRSVASKILIMIFSLLGVVVLGLILAMTRSIIQESASSIIFFHRVESARVVALKKILQEEQRLTRKDAFDKMIHIRDAAKRKQHLLSFGVTILIYTIIWTLGALVFKFAEDWSYFNALYFCFLCLVTIGYGDYVPKTGAGRAFFVVWSLAAVPMVSAILCTVGDALFQLAKSADLNLSKRLDVFYVLKSFPRLFPQKDIFSDDDSYETDTNEFEDADDPEGDTVLSNMAASFSAKQESSASSSGWESFNLRYRRTGRHSRHRPPTMCSQLKTLQTLVQAVKEFHSIAMRKKNYNLTYKQWNKLLQLYASPDNVEVLSDPCFWLTEYSPLRFPVDEPQYAVSKIFLKMEQFLQDLIESNDPDMYDILMQTKEDKMGPDMDSTLRSDRERRRLRSSSI